MCGRFTLTWRERERLAAELGVDPSEIPEADYKPRWNIAPTDPHWIVRIRLEEREILPAKWGLVNTWAKDAKRAAAQINARAETIATSGAFRDAFANRRCVVPADGFYEWVGAGNDRRPIWFHRPDDQLILFAGLYESWPATPDTWQRTFTIITTTPNAVVTPIHDRMPVILNDEAADRWLDPRETDKDLLKSLLAPAPEDALVTLAVSQRVNSVRNDDPACLQPAETNIPLL
ncbi:MAG TPA: SOS response-associated peptidase [Dehalococcoidia bacterium]|jgi:putative SOS response-associated peptidase YedK|nr:SOS response-associated peptidase [Dehalococcoidia bacterium]